MASRPWSLGQRPRSWRTVGLRGSTSVPPDLYPIRKVLTCSEYVPYIYKHVQTLVRAVFGFPRHIICKELIASPGSHWIHALVAHGANDP
jgi:hypothetical protein